MTQTGAITESAEARVKTLGLQVAPMSRPLASYVPFVRTGNLVYVSGQVPTRDGKPIWTGKVGREVPLEEAKKAARQTVVQLLSILREAAGSLDNVTRIVRVTAHTNAAPGFTDVHVVANGASDLLVEVFGDAGRHSRMALGAAELPLNVPFALDVIAEIR